MRPWPRRRILLVQLALVLLGVMWLSWRVYSHWPQSRIVPATPPDKQTDAQFPHRRYTADDLRRIASGDAAGVDLIENLFYREFRGPAEHVELAARFGPPGAGITESRRIGWPATWLTYRYDSTADDAYTRAGARPLPSERMGQTMWSARSWINWSLDGTRRRVTIFTPEAFGATALVLLVGWHVGRAGRVLTPHRRGRLARALPWAGLASAAMLIAALSTRPEQERYLMPRPFSLEGHPTGVRISEVDRSPAAQQRLARAILDAVGEEQQGVLILGTIPRAQITGTGWGMDVWPRPSLSRVEYHAPSSGAGSHPIWGPETIVLWRWAPRDQTTAVSVLSIRTHAFFNVILAAAVLWHIPLAVRHVAGCADRARSRRRAVRGLCVNCGYPSHGKRPS